MLGLHKNIPLVSVIIPNLNGMHLLEKCIGSLMKTDYPNLEIIVVDNGSTDGSICFLAEKFPQVKVIRFALNKGVAAAYNAGLTIARGTFVSFLNNDIEVDENWLWPLVVTLQYNSKLAGCESKYLNYFKRSMIDSSGGAGRFIDKYGNAVNRGGGQYDRGQFDDLQEVFHGLSLFRKSLVEKLGGFDEKFFAYYDETDLCWRLHRAGYKIMYVPASKIYHMGSITTSTSFKGKRKLKKAFIFHSHKNRLRMLIKNQFGINLFFSIFVFLSDTIGIILTLLITRNVQDIIPIIKGVFWNLWNLEDTLLSRQRFKNESTVFYKLFLPYSGIWRLIITKL